MTINMLNFTLGLPNIMTICRIVLTPMFVILLLKGKFCMALFTFTIAGISDGLDGFIARYFNQRTLLGSYLDPLADKLLLVSAFICLSILKIIPIWFTIVVVCREILILLGILVLTFKNRCFRVNPSFLSKCNTTLQIITVIESLLILLYPNFSYFHYIFCWSSLSLTFLSGIQYICIWLNMLYKVI